MLLGEYKHNMDAKGRLIIPSKFRDDLGESFIVTRGLDGCLFGYPQKQWSVLQDKINQLPLAKKETRSFARFFYSAATECELDKQGRVNIPQTLRDYAKLEKNCVVIGVSQRFEIWSEERWETYASTAEESFEEFAEDMIDFGL
ncbi:division/cell wall cluster transcriptional repressor MraZ [Lacticigenium naphthae]|uniref:division/cell wall cluster transcriptional repressor MraZ n=1 Tax=Lacticigenium naphthae TaxID=515351 RepID=UPI000409B715|nr:division/cell wall cluster transcriptional repressor MraZ [Lacticigenium naphthae]